MRDDGTTVAIAMAAPRTAPANEERTMTDVVNSDKRTAMMVKLAALRTLAARASTQAEAEAAAAQAEAIATKYQIDEAFLRCEIARLAALREYGRKAQNAFRMGAVVGVIRAMRAARAVAVAAAPTGAAMVLHNRSAEAQAWLKATGVKTRNTTGRSPRDAGAYERGKAAGSGLHNRGALPTGGGPLRLGPKR